MIDQASLDAAERRFSSGIPGIIDASVISHDGLVMTSTSKDIDLNDLLGAMSSEIIAKGKQSVRELELGELWGNALFGTSGAMLTRIINEEMLLLVRIRTEASIARVFDEMNKVVSQLSLE